MDAEQRRAMVVRQLQVAAGHEPGWQETNALPCPRCGTPIGQHTLWGVRGCDLSRNKAAELAGADRTGP